MSYEARHLIITGQVQGVGFRYAMLRAARGLGVNGWVRNRHDGSVEALVIGEAQQIAAMLNWARHGPDGAEVKQVAVEWQALPDEAIVEFTQQATV